MSQVCRLVCLARAPVPGGDWPRSPWRPRRSRERLMPIGNLPDVVSREQWLIARKELLGQEKELTRHQDQVNAARRRLPMVRIDKPYTFQGPDGTVSLSQLFAGRPQLVVHHFM